MSALVKKAMKIAFIVLGVYYGWVFFVGPGSKAIIRAILMKREPPNPIYGLLDPLEFANANANVSNAQYQLNTKNGGLPGDLPYKMDVYKFAAPAYSYLAGEDAAKDALSLGYTNDDLTTDLKGRVYQWRKLDTGSTLTINIDTKDIYGATSLNQAGGKYQRSGLSKDSAIKSVLGLFSSLNRLDDLYKNGVQSVDFGVFSGNSIVNTMASADYQIAKVNLYRKLGNYMILGPDPKEGLLYAYFGVSLSQSRLLSYPLISGYFHQIEPKASSSYAIIDVDTAWTAVKSGKGVVSGIVPVNSNPFQKSSNVNVDQILIDNIYLAYYETPKAQKYLQPIYVFEGKYKVGGVAGGSITIYLPAVSGEYVKSTGTPGSAQK